MSTIAAPIRHVQAAIDWSEVQVQWDAMLDRHDRERAEFIQELLGRGAGQDEIADRLGISRVHVSRLSDYSSALKLVPVGTNGDPTERELRPFISAAAAEIATERGVDRVRTDRAEVHQRAADLFIVRPYVAHNSGNNEWYTPQPYIDAARTVMGGIDLDPASSAKANEVVKADRFYTAEQDGLARKWWGRVWLNPPYASSLIGRFADKLVSEYQAGNLEQAIALVNNATETEWFGKIADIAGAVVFPSERVKFWAVDGRIAAPLQGQAVLYVGAKEEKFVKVFKQFGAGAYFAHS